MKICMILKQFLRSHKTTLKIIVGDLVKILVRKKTGACWNKSKNKKKSNHQSFYLFSSYQCPRTKVKPSERIMKSTTKQKSQYRATTTGNNVNSNSSNIESDEGKTCNDKKL
jgi:flagellar basal body L-ring protein FlgH